LEEQHHGESFAPLNPNDGTRILLLTIEEGARLLRTSRTLLYAAIAKRPERIKTIKLGRSRRIHIDEINRIAREGLE
jgi:excisionase family DNA binding protein